MRIRYMSDVIMLRVYDNGDNSEMREFENAHFISRGQALEILAKVKRWYDIHSDEEIEEENLRLQHDEDQRMAELSSPRKRSRTSKPGVVYLAKCGEYYKIGKSVDFPQRKIQLATQLPHPFEVVHLLTVNDPVAVEHYYHRLFKTKRLNGEWFDLTATDIQEFMNHK